MSRENKVPEKTGKKLSLPAAPAPAEMVMVPTHLSVDQLEAFVGRGLCCGSEPIEEAVIDAGHKWTRLLGRIAAAPAPAVPDPWRMAVDAAMVGHALDCTTPDSDPKQCVELLCKQVADIWRDIAAPAVPEGEIVITKNEDGAIVSVTRQDEEGRIISVLAESAAPAVPDFYSRQSPLVQDAMGIAMVKAWSIGGRTDAVHPDFQCGFEAGWESAAPAVPAVACKGIPRKGCNYLTPADTVCNKCGEIHHHHQMLAHFDAKSAAPAVREPLTDEQINDIWNAKDLPEHRSHLTPWGMDRVRAIIAAASGIGEGGNG
jgi:hypothetical protein